VGKAGAKKATEPLRQKPPVRTRDAEATRRDILAVSVEEFAAKGLSGARIDEIAARTNTSKRMIYYYFESKEGLYIAVLEHIYATQRSLEMNNDYDRLEPVEAMKQLIGSSFDHHVGRPNFINIVMDENLHQARHLKQSRKIRIANVSVIEILRGILARGASLGVFKAGIDPVELHLTISALSFHFVANRHTFGAIFEVDMVSPKAVARRRQVVVDLVLASIRA
jgi:AcrR family transcriptional regulator